MFGQSEENPNPSDQSPQTSKLKRLISGILYTGFHAEMPKRSADQLVLINCLSMLGIAISTFYVVLYFFHFGIAFTIVDTIAGLLYLSNFFWQQRGLSQAPPRIILAVASLQITAGTIIWGPKADLHLYGIILSYGAYMMLPKAESWEKYLWSLISFSVFMFGFIAKETTLFGVLFQPDLPAWQPWTSRIGAFLLCLIILKILIHAKDQGLEELEHGKALMEKAQRIATFGSFHLALPTHEVTWSDELHRIYNRPLNFEPEDLFNLADVHPDDRELVAEKLRNIENLILPQQLEYRILLENQRVVYLKATLDAEYGPGGNVLGIYGSCQNVSREKYVAKALKDQEGKLVAASKLSALGEMAGGIAHEINNPLTVITGKARQLKVRINQGADAKGLIPDLEIIESTAFRIAKIVRGMRSFSRDGTKDPPTEASFSNILDDTLPICQDRLKNHGVELIIVSCPEDLKLISRPIQISQVLVNLINNAYDAVEPLSAEDRWIRIAYERADELLKVSISNGGPKITAEVVAGLMTPFFTTKPPGKGTGLGLAISRGIIEEHGGRIYVDESETFTTFVIELNLYSDPHLELKRA